MGGFVNRYRGRSVRCGCGMVGRRVGGEYIEKLGGAQSKVREGRKIVVGWVRHGDGTCKADRKLD